MRDDISGYRYSDARLNNSHGLLLPAVMQCLAKLNPAPRHRRIFELGCGNGAVANRLTQCGWEVNGVDPSKEGIDLAHLSFPNIKLFRGSAYEDLSGQYGCFPVVMSLEVIEHVYFPRKFANTLFGLCEPGGTALVSTPYHGYWKNLAMALTGRMDKHFTALWDNGHIKFWSIKTLTLLLREAGFKDIRFQRVGRIPSLAKAMIAIARKPCI